MILWAAATELLDNGTRYSMISSPSSYRPALWCSVVGAAAAIALTVFLRSLLGTRLLAEVLLDVTTDGPSPQDFSFLLRTLEELARPLLLVSVLPVLNVLLKHRN